MYVKDDKEKLKVFGHSGVYLPMKKIGKNNPKAVQIEADNKQRQLWNNTVDRALVSGIMEQQILKIKKSKISEMVKEDIGKNGNHPQNLYILLVIIQFFLNFFKLLFVLMDFVILSVKFFIDFS